MSFPKRSDPYTVSEELMRQFGEMKQGITVHRPGTAGNPPTTEPHLWGTQPCCSVAYTDDR